MGLSKSQSDFYVTLVSKLFLDLSLRYPSAQKSFKRDIVTLQSRYRHEGLSFLTKTLPKLGKWFDQWMVGHNVEIPKEFKTSHENRTIPAFMQGMFTLCSGPDGFRDPSDLDVIRDIRQILFFAYKLDVPCRSTENEAVINNFELTDREVASFDFSAVDSFLQKGRAICNKVLHGFNPKDVRPKHGPGAVATGERLNEKWEFSRLYSRLHQKYPMYDYFVSGGPREIFDRIKWYKSLERLETGCAKVVLVPKDSRGPRLISCEPLEYQYIQQGIGRKLVDHLEKTSSLTRGQVNFTKQSINQELAYKSSIDGLYATIDLKDASDRVSVELVKRLFPENVFDCLWAARTTHTKLPNGKIVELAKFAPMGSALCFPVEALVFWLVCVVAIQEYSRLPLSFVAPRVFVYGDDIIVPTLYAQVVNDALEACGLKVNTSKCFTTGHFRESCGVDAYRGHLVTPLRLRRQWNEKPQDASVYASYLALINQFDKRGYSETCTFLHGMMTSVFGVIPWGRDSSSYPCLRASSYWTAFDKNVKLGVKYRWNTDYSRFEVRVRSLHTKQAHSDIDGWQRMLRDLLVPSLSDPSRVAPVKSAQLRTNWKPA